MPHFTVEMVEEDLAGAEQAVIGALTEAVATVYGAWARPLAVVTLRGVPRHRWGVGGVQGAGRPANVTLDVRPEAMERPGVPAALIEAVTGAMGEVFGDEVRSTVAVRITAAPRGTSGAGGEVM